MKKNSITHTPPKKRTLILGIAVCLVCMLSFGLFGCANNEDNTPQQEQQQETLVDLGELAINIDEMDREYTNNEQQTAYDAENATSIIFDGVPQSDSTNGNVTIDGKSVTITQEGTYIISGTSDDGIINVNTSDDEKVWLVLSNLTLSNTNGPAIYVENAKKTFVLLEGTNNLTDGGTNWTFTGEDTEKQVNGCIFSHDNLSFNGNGTLNINANYKDGIVSKDDLTFCGGTYNVNAIDDGLRGKDSVKVLDGTFNILANEGRAITSTQSNDGTKGFVSIDGGNFILQSGDTGIHAETALFIEDAANISVESADEGYEAEQIYINGGNTDIIAFNDGINATIRKEVQELLWDSDNATKDIEMHGNAMYDGCFIEINDGITHVYSNGEGDGIDSNGSLTMNGGQVFIQSSTLGSESPIDVSGNITINGGKLLAAGERGLDRLFNDGTQNVFAGNIETNSNNANENTVIAITDNSDNVVIENEFVGSVSYVIVSTPELAGGEEYTIKVNDSDVGTVTEVQNDDISGMHGGERSDKMMHKGQQGTDDMKKFDGNRGERPKDMGDERAGAESESDNGGEFTGDGSDKLDKELPGEMQNGDMKEPSDQKMPRDEKQNG